MTRERARALRKAFRAKSASIAAEYHASQLDHYPPEYRAREGERILREYRFAEASLATEMQKWNYAQQVEAARLSTSSPWATRPPRRGDSASSWRSPDSRPSIATTACSTSSLIQPRSRPSVDSASSSAPATPRKPM